MFEPQKALEGMRRNWFRAEILGLLAKASIATDTQARHTLDQQIWNILGKHGVAPSVEDGTLRHAFCEFGENFSLYSELVELRLESIPG